MRSRRWSTCFARSRQPRSVRAPSGPPVVTLQLPWAENKSKCRPEFRHKTSPIFPKIFLNVLDAKRIQGNRLRSLRYPHCKKRRKKLAAGIRSEAASSENQAHTRASRCFQCWLQWHSETTTPSLTWYPRWNASIASRVVRSTPTGPLVGVGWSWWCLRISSHPILKVRWGFP